MKQKFFAAVIPFWLTFSPQLLFAQTNGGWSEIKGDHFIVSYQENGRNFANSVLHKAEVYYNQIAGSLGYSRRSDFWLWDNRCLIYLYKDKDAFHQVTHQASWSSGFAIPEKRTIVSYLGAAEFLGSVLPHELTHLIFRDFVGIENNSIPLWLDEGLAMANEEAKRIFFDQWVHRIISEKRWVPIGSMTQIRSLNGTSTEQAAIFYAQAQSMVRFLLRSGEPSRFIQLCRDLRDGSSLENALRKNYPRQFETIEVFEKEWVRAYA